MLPCRSGRFWQGARLSFLLLLVSGCVVFAGSKHRKATPTPTPETPKEDLGLKNIPLTVGHEAKGLVLPNYDLQGNLLGRFEAATAARVDENHVRFGNLKMTTYDPQQKPDLNVTMSQATLNLETKVIDSNQRTNVKRADFEIDGDSMIFNTTTHQGKLTGNVHMTIFNQQEIAGAPSKK